MVDRVYKSDLPRLRRSLEEMRQKFAELDTKTDWVGLRVEPLLRHAESLEERLESPEFSPEFARLRKGVAMFHSDLVYLRTNVDALQKVLESERQSAKKRD